jgi:hypothetical protein
MNQVVMVPIPLSPEAAERIGDEERRRIYGRVMSRLVNATAGHDDMLEAFLDSLPRDPSAPDLTDEEIQAEIDAVRAGRRR